MLQSNFTCSQATYAAVLYSALQTRVLSVRPLQHLNSVAMWRRTASNTSIQDLGWQQGWLCTEMLHPEFVSRGAAWLDWPHDNSALPQGELDRAASATPCDKSMRSRRRAPTSPPSDQKIRFSFAVEPNSVLLYWHKKHQRGGTPVGNIITFWRLF